jgi:NAD-dependent deacetylase
MEALLDRAASVLSAAKRVVVLTGAGISAESGIRTFRDTMEGLWKEFDPQTLATPQAFAADPALVSRWYDHRRIGCLHAEPNPGHTGLAQLQHTLLVRGGSFTLVTQNVDRLHQRAGSTGVLELHGNIHIWRCTRTSREMPLPPEPLTEFPVRSPFDPAGLLRPGVVWFGEALPAETLQAAEEAASAADVLLTIGTSAVVYPAAGLIDLAAAAGATTIEINPTTTAASSRVEIVLTAKAGLVLPELLRRMAR